MKERFDINKLFKQHSNLKDDILLTENEDNRVNTNNDDSKDESFDVNYELDNSKDESSDTEKPQDFFFEPPCRVRLVNGTTVMFQGSVSEQSVNLAIQLIKQAFLNVNNISLNYPELKGKLNIKLILDTPGGSIIQGFRLVDTIQYYNKNTDVNVIGVVQGMCASMGVPILLSCKEKYATENSTIMIHSLSAGMMGKYQEMKDYMKFYNDLQEKLIKFVVQNSKAKEKDIRDLFERESFLTTEEAISFGIIDGVMDLYY